MAVSVAHNIEPRLAAATGFRSLQRYLCVARLLFVAVFLWTVVAICQTGLRPISIADHHLGVSFARENDRALATFAARRLKLSCVATIARTLPALTFVSIHTKLQCK